MTGFIFGVITLFFALAGIILLAYLAKRGFAGLAARSIKLITSLIALLLVVATGFSFMAGFNSGQGIFKNAFVREVNMEQVPVKGEISFPAGIEIIFREGELSDIVLIEGSTKSKK